MSEYDQTQEVVSAEGSENTEAANDAADNDSDAESVDATENDGD